MGKFAAVTPFIVDKLYDTQAYFLSNDAHNLLVLSCNILPPVEVPLT